MPRRVVILAGITVLLHLAVVAVSASEAQVQRERHRQVAAVMRDTYVFVGGGSGVLVSEDGLVLTNYHVTEEQVDWQLYLADGTQHHAVMVGMDPVGDLALLRIDGDRDWPHLRLGDRDRLRVGITVFAIGNPFSLGQTNHEPTLTGGTLGAVRLVRGDYTDCVQIDAPVNPGNSGGPLVDGEGFLLGINGQIRTRSGLRVNSGIGLAIACTQINEFLPALQAAAGGYVHHTSAPKGLTWEQRDGVDGVFVTAVPASSPALQVGDRLVTVADRPVASAAGCAGLFAAGLWSVDRQVTLQVQRGDELVSVQVPTGRTAIPGRPWHGLRLLHRKDAATIKLVEEGSPAARAGIKAGEVLRAVDGHPIDSQIAFLKALVGKETGDTITCTVRAPGDGGTEREVAVYLRRR